MANKLDKHYNDFGGVDTRSNRLMMNPKTMRDGTLNVCYDFEDQIVRRGGFQHKTQNDNHSQYGLMQYKYRDVDTGESKSQVLGVGADFQLYRKINNRLKITKTSGAVEFYSMFYDENADQWVFSLGPFIGSVSVSDSMTLSQLATALNALAVAGITFSVVDDAGNSISSSQPAYLLDCVIEGEIIVGDTLTDVWLWELVPYPGDVPFLTTQLYHDTPAYEGVSSCNLNNVIYMTDGGFPLAYDGDNLHRVGMPKFSNALIPYNVFLLTDNFGGNMTPNANYRYAYQFGFVDKDGSEIVGKLTEADFLTATLASSDNVVQLPIYPIGNSDFMNDGFNVLSMCVNGLQTLNGAGSKTLTVQAGHNILPGMCLRIPIMNASNGGTPSVGWSFAYYLVTAVTATTVTFNKTVASHIMPIGATALGGTQQIYLRSSAVTPDIFIDGSIIQACYVPDKMIGQVTEPPHPVDGGNIEAWQPFPIYGAFCRVFRSLADQTVLYRLADVPISHQFAYLLLDGLADSDVAFQANNGLSRLTVDFSSGEEIPRACKYLSTWQNQTIQAGRPPSSSQILDKPYPYYFGTAPTTGNKWGGNIPYAPWNYTEADLCDFQSIYWADPIAVEGFPRSGLFEQAIDSSFNDEIKGIAPNKDAFFAFKQRSTALLTGSLATQNITTEILESDAGCSSHLSIQSVAGSLLWLDGVNGFWSCVAGRLPLLIGYPICDFQKINSAKLDFNKAVSATFRGNDWYVCTVEGQTFVYDYAETTHNKKRNCWYLFEGFSATAMLATADDELIFSDSGRVWKMKTTLTKYDYTDHKSAINWVMNTAWIHLGAPTIDKHWINSWINSIQGDFTLQVGQAGNFIPTVMNSIPVKFVAETSAKKTVKEEYKANIAKLSSISIQLANTEKNKYIRIQGYEIQYSADFDAGEPKR